MPLAKLFTAVPERFLRWRKQRDWERRWRSPNYQPLWLTDAPRAFVVAGVEKRWLAPGKTVLEIGCGLGTAAVWMAERGMSVVAIDISKHVIEEARKKFPDRAGLEFCQVDACEPTGFARTFDVIIDTGCLQHVPARLRDGYCENLLAWSRKGGRFVVTMHQRDHTASERLAEVQELLSSKFDLVLNEEEPAPTGQKGFMNSIFHFVRK